jgi:hypothetical protein
VIDKLQGGHLGRQPHQWAAKIAANATAEGAIVFAYMAVAKAAVMVFCSKEGVNANSYGAPQNPTDAQ